MKLRPWLLAGVLALLAPGAQAARVGPALQHALAAAAADQELQVVVTFKGRAAPAAGQLGALAALGVTGFHFRHLPIAGVVASPAQVHRIAALPSVRSVWLNERLEWQDRQATTLTGVEELRAEPLLRNRHGMPYTGRGVGVLVNDSGIDGTHPDLSFPDHLVQNATGLTNPAAYGRLANDPDIVAIIGEPPVATGGILPALYTENIANTDAANSHGTHVAGIVGGSGAQSGGRFTGVAPGANLVGYGSGAGLLVLDGLGGFDYALRVRSHYNVRVINNSFGSPSDVGNGFDPDHPFAVASKILADLGMIVVFAAGNYYDEDSIGGSWVKAPWQLVAAAGTKNGQLSDFSSRGAMGRGPQTVVVDGETYTWEDRPTVTAPGQAILSTKAKSVDPLALTGLIHQSQLRPYVGNELQGADLLWYIGYDGTSMAAPHLAGVVALLLEANPALTWRGVKRILEATATPMPGRQPWEAGAGYVDAYSAVAMAAGKRRDYGKGLPLLRRFNADAAYTLLRTQEIVVDAQAVGATPPVPFTIDPDAALVEAWMVDNNGAVTLVMTDPDGRRYDSGILPTQPVLDPGIAVFAPGRAGEWHATIAAWDPLVGPILNIFLNIFGVHYTQPVNATAPGPVTVRIKQYGTPALAGLSDIDAHPAQDEIVAAARSRLVDGLPDGRFAPRRALTRAQLADFLTLAGGVRQRQPLDGSTRFTDIKNPRLRAAADAVTRAGAVLRDRGRVQAPLMFAEGGEFRPGAIATRLDVAYALIQSLGMEALALGHAGPVTVARDGQTYEIADLGGVPAERLGYVQLALDLGVLDAEFATLADQSVVARFRPAASLARADLARAANRVLGLHRRQPTCADDAAGPCLF